MNPSDPRPARTLEHNALLGEDKIFNPSILSGVTFPDDLPVLVLLAAGKGTRFGTEPKCIQPVHGTPLARHSVDAFRRLSPNPAICIIGYRHEDVAGALGSDNIYVVSSNPAGGTALAAYEAFSIPVLDHHNPLIVVTMGDRIVPPSIFRRLCDTHRAGGREADITFLTAIYEPPKNRGKGRVIRDADRRVTGIIEERDILARPEGRDRQAMLDLQEGNCPLYAIRASLLRFYLERVTNDNAQGQFYITDIISAIVRDGGEIRTITTSPSDIEYDLLCSDVTQPMDLALLEGTLASSRGLLFPEEVEVEEAARRIRAGRPQAQIASIARQLREVAAAVSIEELGFEPDRPVGIGISGGRLRIAFMHPDMGRFFGPAWQMPIGAGREDGDEQIVVLVQAASDGRIHLYPIEQSYREKVNSLAPDSDAVYPGEEISDAHSYEGFGTRMSEHLLLSLGYFTDEEVQRRREKGLPLPPHSLWVGNNMRRPFALVMNALASIRTLRQGNLGLRVQEHLGRERFEGLRMVTTGSIPQGGFSSSSAVVVATENAIDAIWQLGIPPDILVQLACQAEYGTGVRAGSLDQATEQKGRAGQGTLISSNPRDNYKVIGTYPVPTDRIQILFPYTVERDRAAWRWSWGAYSESGGQGALTTSETRKMTGKAAEIAALLTELPLDTDFFKEIEHDLVSSGELTLEKREWIRGVLLKTPMQATHRELQDACRAKLDWFASQIAEFHALELAAARAKAESTVASLFAGWRDPQGGVPLRAMLAYLFGEVAKNFHLIHHPEDWIESVTLSQMGDRCFSIDPANLPTGAEMEGEIDWELGVTGPDRLNLWMNRCGARPFDYNRGLDCASLAAAEPPRFERLEGSNFFRGLALIDLAEAMLKRAFGNDAVAVRVNAAGQGDYFQVHVDKQKADPADVKRFIQVAYYRRFGLTPQPEFVEIHPGGGATGVRLHRYDMLGQLIQRLRQPD